MSECIGGYYDKKAKKFYSTTNQSNASECNDFSNNENECIDYCTWIPDKNSQNKKLKIFDYEHLTNLIDYCFAQTTNTWEISGIRINNWDVSNVSNLNNLFNHVKSSNFNEDISSWNVSNVTNMQDMFKNCTTFNQNISSWNVNNVEDMSRMFMNCTNFNQDISSWDVSSVEFMSQMFEDCTNFNQNISSWNVSNSISMDKMFKNCTNFVQDLSNWKIPKITSNTQLENMFENVQLPTCTVLTNFDGGYGPCNTYHKETGGNKGWCNFDKNNLGIKAQNACSECFNRNNECSEITELDYSQFIKS